MSGQVPTRYRYLFTYYDKTLRRLVSHNIYAESRKDAKKQFQKETGKDPEKASIERYPL